MSAPLSRRGALTALAATTTAAGLGIAPAIAAAAHPDAELIALGKLLVERRAALFRLAPQYSDEQDDLLGEEIEAITDYICDLEEEIDALPAQTLKGCAVKADRLYWVDQDFVGNPRPEDGMDNLELAQKHLLEDVMRLAEAST